MTTCWILISITCITLLPVLSYSQAAVPENSFQKTIQVYRKMVGDQSGLYNGGFYYNYPFHIHNGHPYFLKNTPLKGNVFYDGFLYENITLLHDEISGQLITPDYKKQNYIQLVKGKVDSFTIDNHRFIRVDYDSAGTIGEGFYQLLHQGKSNVLKKEKKVVKEKIVSQVDRIRTVETETIYYVFINNNYHEVKNSRTLLNQFGSQKKKIGDTLKSKSLRFRSDRELYIIEAISLYDQLTS